MVTTPDNPNSTVTRIKHGRRASESVILTADNMSIRTDSDGFLIFELFRYGPDDKAVESYQMRLCPLDRANLKIRA